jgi:hypothetical protein
VAKDAEGCGGGKDVAASRTQSPVATDVAYSLPAGGAEQLPAPFAVVDPVWRCRIMDVIPSP